MFFYPVEAGMLDALGREVLDLVMPYSFFALMIVRWATDCQAVASAQADNWNGKRIDIPNRSRRRSRQLPRSGNGLERGRPARRGV
jgi:hypothetical protein